MRFDERFLDEIKTRVRLSDVIGRTVKLRRQGREYVGLSPFAKEKTPSFYVNDEKGFFHDFSSGKHGDLIAFWQETERLSFPEAVERLAAEAGVPMPAPDAHAAEVETKRAGLGEWLEIAAKWYEAQLRRPVGAAARTYLAGRALPEEEWARFRLGFAPGGRTALKDYLIAKGAQPRDLIEAGLLIEPEDGAGAPYDRFRDRIIFPIADARGRVISFGGRAMDAEARAKYLNGPDSPLFHKGQTLYGLAEARRLLHVGGESPPLVVVEGYMDVLACQRAEIAAVAAMGTALTEEQMERLWRLHPEPTLCFDADKAGLRAASRTIDRALPHLKPGRSFRFALITGGKDPDDVLREQGAAALKAQVQATRPFVEALFQRERELEPLDTPEHRAGLKARLRAAAAAIQDKDLAQAYRDDLLNRLDQLFAVSRPQPTARAPRAPFRKGRWKPDPLADRPAEPELIGVIVSPYGKIGARALPRRLKQIAAAIALHALRHPPAIDDWIERLAQYGFGDAHLADFAKQFSSLYEQDPGLDSESLKRHLAASGFNELLGEIEKAGLASKAPFLKSDISPERAQVLWSRAFETLVELAALEDALVAAKDDMQRTLDSSHQRFLKTRHAALERSLSDGTVWGDEGS
jgi:DNA primase